MKERSDVKLLVVDVKQWTSPVARQHRIRQLPTLWLYEGRTLKTADTNRVLAALK